MTFAVEPWMLRGLCPKFGDVNFVPDPFLGEDPLPAKQVCKHCPVTAQCEAYGTEHMLLGVWGGKDESERVTRVATSTCPCGSGAAIQTTLGLVCRACGEVT